METTRPISQSDSQLPPYEVVQSSNYSTKDTRLDQHSAMDIDSSTERGSRAPSTFSMDDIEVAKALTGLREGMNRPIYYIFAYDMLASPPAVNRVDSQSSAQPQPLLTLLTSQHPLIASAMNGSLSAYTSSKSYSPSFRVGAEFVERNIATPVANTVGTASRISGVETGVRWWLERKDSGNNTAKVEKGQKRRRESNDTEIDRSYIDAPPLAHRQRAISELSQPEYLPPYDDQRSPVYEENYVTSQQQSPQLAQQSWQTRLAISTSGLGVAMSDESLKSLRYCLTWLRWANSHLSKVLSSLHDVLGEWERSQQREEDRPDETVTITVQTRDPATIANHLQALKTECVKVLKTALDVVSKYAGGALPENARWIVKVHLTSLPARFRSSYASQDQAESNGTTTDEENQKQPEAVTGAQRVIVLAKEGLDMMAQVTAVVDGTIISAEEWIEKLGRKKNSDPEHPNQPLEKNLDGSLMRGVEHNEKA
jgi:transcriptional repressor OPI1